MTRLSIHTFGGLQVFPGGHRPVPLPAKKVQALFVYLALHAGRPQPRAKLAALLWSESNDSQARASLRQALLVLRRSLALSDAELGAGPGETIELAESCVDVDACSFELLLADGAGPDALEEATRLYTGEFLEALETREPAFDDWLMAQRQRLRERAIDGLSRLLALHSEQGRLDRAIEVALRLLALDPLQESVHRTLMQLYARQGRPASALRQFQLLRDVLARELGTRPQAQSVQLRESIERQRGKPAAPAHAADEPPAAPRMELRPVAVVVVEPPAGTEETDPERAQAANDAFAADVGEVVASFRGLLEQRFGGSVSAFFGVPVAHGNDVERAARFALALRERMPDLRAGLSAGTALVTRRPDPGETADAPCTVSGETAGLAARLAAAATGGDVFVSEAAWRGLAHDFEAVRCHEAALPLSLRSAGCWRLLARRRAPLARPSLVGRRTELGQFTSSLEACRRTGTGLTFHVRGDPGIGKSRLVEEFREIAAAHGFACHGGAVVDFGSSVERDPLRTLVQGLLEMDPAGEAETQTALARAKSAGLLEPAHHVHVLDLLQQPLPPPLRTLSDAMDHATREREQSEVLADLLRRCSARVPRLLVLEDLHWASARTLRRAATLAAAAERCPAVLVTTARSDGDPLDAAWRGSAGVSALITLDLGPLRWADASALAAQFGDAADAFVLRCVERSGGNPLFLEQLLRAGRDATDALPASVQSVVQARLDRLDPAESHAVRVASVLGQRFRLAALNNLLAGASWEPHRAQGLVRFETSDGVFAHALVHEGAYASLPRAERSALHARAALWFRGRDAMLRAEHLDRAEDAGAAQAYLEAAQAEASAHRHEQAARLAQRGLDRAADPELRFALACCRADALHDVGSMGAAEEAYRAALAAAGDEAQRCRAWIGVAAVLRVRDDLDGAASALAAAERAATAAGLTEQQARIHFLRGNLCFPRGDLDGCEREHERSLSCARAARSEELEAAAMGGLGDAAFLRGHMLTARERFGGCVALARRQHLKRVEAANLPMAAFARWYGGDTRGALADAQAAVAAAVQIGHRRAEAIAHHGGYQFSHALMQFGAARDHADRALLLARQLEAPRFEAEALAFRGELLRTQGDRSAALDELRQALSIARATGMSYMGPIFLGMLARASDETAARVEALREAEALLATNPIGHNHLLFRRDAIDASLDAHEWEEALRHADALAARTRAQPLPWSEFLIARARALARHGARRDRAGLSDELERLRAEGRRIGLLEPLVAIDAALSVAGGLSAP